MAGATVSVTHGIQELLTPQPASHFLIGYIVLALSFVLEGISFLQSVRQTKPEAESMQRDLIEHVLVTSDPTLRAVFAEDSAAMTGLLIAAAGLAAHQLTGSPVPDAVGSIVIGVMLAVTAIILINLNRRFLVGQEADPRVRVAAIHALLDAPEVARVLSAARDRRAPDGLGHRRRRSHRRSRRVPPRRPAAGASGQDQRLASVAGAVLRLSAPDEPTLVV
jgi:divalent metal cation (Fe/Co/Zn/Cd) transporter